MNWPITIQEARALQERLRQEVITTDTLGAVRVIAGVDTGYEGELARAAAVAFAYPSLRPLAYRVARRPARFPYVPGFLSFREAPAALAAIEGLEVRPDLLLCDGQGIAHPRRFGIACHLGVLTGLPSIGCAKSRLFGWHDEVPEARGARVPLRARSEEIGAVLRTRVGVKPLYISVGHRVSLETALRFVLACVTRYRLPEPIRAADALASHGRLPQLEAPQGDLFGTR
jgi:deoxyribonuclease V